MTIALGAKTKLRFVYGSVSMPDQHDENYLLWKKINKMVMAWILNSISKDIIDAFLFANTAYESWEELKDGFGKSNGPLLYKIQREICSFSQGNNSVTLYYTGLKKLWDEMSCITPVTYCTSGLRHVST